MLWVIFVALMALYAAYSANIVVLLQAPSTAIRTVEQLSASGITLGALDTDYNRFVFRVQYLLLFIFCFILHIKIVSVILVVTCRNLNMYT